MKITAWLKCPYCHQKWEYKNLKQGSQKVTCDKLDCHKRFFVYIHTVITVSKPFGPALKSESGLSSIKTSNEFIPFSENFPKTDDWYFFTRRR